MKTFKDYCAEYQKTKTKIKRNVWICFKWQIDNNFNFWKTDHDINKTDLKILQHLQKQQPELYNEIYGVLQAQKDFANDIYKLYKKVY